MRNCGLAAMLSWLAWISADAANAQLPKPTRATGKEQDAAVQLRDFSAGGQVAALAFSPDGEQLAVRVPETPNVYVWAWRNARLIRAQPAGESLGMAAHRSALTYSPDGKVLALAHDVADEYPHQPIQGWRTVVHLWDGRSGQLVHVLAEVHESGAPAIEFTPDGERLLRVYGRNSEMPGDQFVVYRVRDWRTEWGLRVLPFQPERLAVSPDGRYVALGGLVAAPGVAMHAPIWIVDMATHQIIRRIDAFPADSNVGDLSWSPDGERVAAGASVFNVYPGVNTVKVFTASTGKQIAGSPAPDQMISAVKFALRGRYLVESGDSGFVTIWDGSLRRMIQRLPSATGPIAVSRDTRLLAVASGTHVSVWELR